MTVVRRPGCRAWWWLVAGLGAAPVVVLLAWLVYLRIWPRGREAYDIPDEAAFSQFLEEDPARRREYQQFVEGLDRGGVGEVVAPWHLWRQGTDWRALGEPPFAIPPRAAWGEIQPTLKVLRGEVVPRVGPVEVVSGYRSTTYNRRAGGAARSQHLRFDAVDVVPLQRWRRGALHDTLVGWWASGGARHRIGLGLYDGVRFHIDTSSHRRW